MIGVVHELQVDVRVVDGRVATLRVVADVERVVRACDDRQPGLVGRVEHGRGNLADPAAEAGLELPVDDHGRFLEALVSGASARRLIEGERLSRRDQVPVHEM